MSKRKPETTFQRVWRALGSLRLFVILAVLISGWCVALLLIYPREIVQVDAMNERLLLNWFLDTSDPAGHAVRGWLAGLIALFSVLALNLIVCVIDDIGILARLVSKRAPARLAMARLGILLMHAAYIIIITGHVLSAVSGTREHFTPAKGHAWSSSSAPFTARVLKIKTMPDKKKPGGVIANMAVIELDGGPFDKRKIKLKPKNSYRFHGWQLSLNMAKRGEKNCPDPAAGRVLCNPPIITVMRNPGLQFIFIGTLLFFPGIILRMIFRTAPSA
jgi:cytochrome c biogenesis factor